MKKMSFVIGVIACMMFFTGCGKDNVEVPVVNPDQQIQQPVEDNKQEEPKEESKVEEPKEENKEENKVEEPKEENKVEEPKEENKVEEPKEENKVEEPKEDNKVEEPKEENKVEEPSITKALTDVMNAMVEKAGAQVNFPFLEAIPADVSLGFVGIDTDEFNQYVSESVVYESNITPAFQSLAIVKINDSSKVAELKQKVFDNANPRKWVCTSAEKVVVVESGNYILLAMSTPDLCDKLVAAFGEQLGATGEVLSRVAEG